MVDSGRIRKIVGANVKKYRVAKHLSVIEAAKALGVGRQYWYLIEKGGGNLPLDSLQAVAVILDVSIHDLLEPRKRREAVAAGR